MIAQSLNARRNLNKIKLAERVGFEPTVLVRERRFSKPLP